MDFQKARTNCRETLSSSETSTPLKPTEGLNGAPAVKLKRVGRDSRIGANPIVWHNSRMNPHNELISRQQQAYALHDRLGQCLKANSAEGSNPEALLEMQSLGLELNRISTHFIAEKVFSLLYWADVLYSDRKHITYGTDQVYGFMQHDLASIKSIIGRMNDDW